jgi:endosialidase-like protein/trimeric autotransporter adhesin
MKKFMKTVILVISILSITTFGQIPRTISYQGMLLDNAGQPLSVTETLTFKLYNVPSGGTILWQESKLVDINDGIFNVILGSDTPLNLSFDLTYYLGITVGVSGTELQPRIQLTSSAYSLNAKSVEDSSITTTKLSDGAVTDEKIATNQVVKSINSIKDSVQLVEGSNITIVPSGNNITISATTSGSSGNTLDQAYDQGGAGAGRTITADNGSFEVNGTDGSLFGGTFGSGSIPVEGAGVRMMWYPNKAAFRAGRLFASGTSFWNDDSIGDQSTAFGFNTRARGNNSTAFGSNTRANGHYSTAMGNSTTASGSNSTALGLLTTASGDNSTALGLLTTASGANSTALGRGIEASGDNTVAIALSNQSVINVSQDNTLAIMGGNVGIGTAAPDYPLTIVPGNALGGLHIDQIKTTDEPITYGINVRLEDNYTGDSHVVGVQSLAIENGGSFNATGLFGIANGNTNGRAYGVRGSAGSTGVVNYGVYGYAGSTGGTLYAVYADGDIAYTGSLINASDKKLKKNEQNLSGILPKLMRLQSKSFYFKTDEYKYVNFSEGLHFGLIAQELEKEFPELVVDAVHPGKQDEEGNHVDDVLRYKGIKSIELIPLLLQGMKEQQEIIENLQKRIEKLERR